jgi:ABC-2 type transport system ATP-binding protein
MLCGLLPASGGAQVHAGDRERTAPARARARIGYVSQKFALYRNLTVLENLTVFGGAYGLTGQRLKDRIAATVAQYGLAPGAKSGDLPGGYQQRLAMAVGLLHEPGILFLDEPTSGIDPPARRAFWRTITGLAGGGVTIIITTHFMEEAEYCDRVAILDSGTLLALGTPAHVRGQAGAPDMNRAFIAVVERARARSAAAVGGKGA